MNPLEYIKTLNHHAYFIHSFIDAVHHLKEYLKSKFQISHSQNPDFYHEKFESFGINESRAIKERHSSKGFSDKKRIFIIETFSMTHEAQNSLLKIFEEPNIDSHFFLIMPSVEVLLPTLRSRLMIIKSEENKQNSDLISEVEKFLKMSKKEKVLYVDEIAKKISDEKLLYKEGIDKNSNSLKAILKARNYLNDRSPSVKQLLEYVALSI